MQHCTTRQTKQKIFANLDHHWSKKCSFLCVQTKWVCPSETQRFCKNDSGSSLESLTVTRVESFCEKRDSSRVTIFLNVTRVRVTKNRDSRSSHWLESRYHCDLVPKAKFTMWVKICATAGYWWCIGKYTLQNNSHMITFCWRLTQLDCFNSNWRQKCPSLWYC